VKSKKPSVPAAGSTVNLLNLQNSFSELVGSPEIKAKKTTTVGKKPIRKVNNSTEKPKKSLVKLKWNRSELKSRIQFVLELFSDFPVDVSIRFCLEPEMTEVNFQFRGKDSATDVLSFPAPPYTLSGLGNFRTSAAGGFSKTKLPPVPLGDILVCLPVCWRASRTHRVTLSSELEKMIIHGLVHLKGFDHERSDAAWKVMTAVEKEILKSVRGRFGIPTFCSVC
jgi:probable rRNA maturation factor